MIPLKLKAIAFFIEKDDKVVDIGCDHGYLDVYLAQENLCKKIIASDINENALQSAINNIDKYKLNKKVKTVLSDGLEKIDSRFINTIVIAGMGCKTIKKILSKNLDGINKIILSSNNDQYELRKFMYSNGYYLDDEKIIYEKKHYYVVSKYLKGKKRAGKKKLLFGIFKEENKKYYKYLLKENNKILKKVPFTKITKRHKLKKENKILKKYLKQKN